MSAEQIALELLMLALEKAPDVISAVTGMKEADLEKKIQRARDAIPELQDVTAEDDSRRKLLEQILSLGQAEPPPDPF